MFTNPLARFDRRSILRVGAAGGGTVALLGALPSLLPGGRAAPPVHHPDAAAPRTQEGGPNPLLPDGGMVHSLSSTVGDVDVARMGFDPSVLVRTFDYGEATTMADGTVVREWDITAYDKEIEIAPGVFFPAWTYNGQVPGPSLRANEGDRLRVHFTNAAATPTRCTSTASTAPRWTGSPASAGGTSRSARSSPTSSRPIPSAATSTTATRRR